jgi:hypothetical protein
VAVAMWQLQCGRGRWDDTAIGSRRVVCARLISHISSRRLVLVVACFSAALVRLLWRFHRLFEKR